MSIDQLVVEHFRNLSALNLEPGPGINVIYGENGSGKSSILESIYFLALGRSFRTHLIPRIVQFGTDHLSIFALLNRAKENEVRVGIERALRGDKKMKLNGVYINSQIPIAQQIPLILLTTESHRYFHDGPKVRRQWLDWGVFHVEHSFYPTWRLFNQALKQRNAALKTNLTNVEIEAWDQDIFESAYLLDEYRSNYIAALEPYFLQMLEALELPHLQLRYNRGWSTERDIKEVLKQDLEKDRISGFTKHGPHRADLTVYADKTPAGDYLSQGQQKLAAYALHLSQGMLIHHKLNHSPIYLIDDLPSELDPRKRQLIAHILRKTPAQMFVTGITLDELSDVVKLEEAKMFHVEQS